LSIAIKPQLNPPAEACFSPVQSGHRGSFIIHIAGDELAICTQSCRYHLG
jgi:hypothetical protein